MAAVWLFALCGSAYAQDPAAPSADRMAPQTRAESIELQRQQKARQLQPEVNGKLENTLETIQNEDMLQRVLGGVPGLHLRLGGLVNRSGFAAGPEYTHALFNRQATFRASVRGSLREYYLMETGLEMPSLGNDHAFFNLHFVHRDYPSIDYYGPGPNSQKTGRSDYRLEDTAFQANTGFRLLRRLSFGATGKYLLVNVGPGTDDKFVSADQIYSEAQAPGITRQSNFLVGGGFAQFDWRDHPGNPRRGGNYRAQWTTYNDTLREHFSFDRLDLEAQQYIGFFNRRRVIALRGRIQATDPHSGNVVPFYLQPTLGGADDLRGFRAFRFYGNNSLILNGEYRWTLINGLDAAVFVDAGRVYNRWQQINFSGLQTDAGFGLRVGMQNSVFLRIDTGFSREGFAVWFKFENVF